ncbi:PTS sugar transporter subunit IIA [Abiotrophia defectiva]|uniref:BglG family transcription antiterminator n=1 Tax=Abiotrophia defectiva TaxID=46125 RepID=UPI0026EAB930|nr:PTS sugar transporter subunit IIA [Abiotrophia defectiva]
MRRKELLKKLKQESFIKLDDLAHTFDVSTRTIRDDVKALNDESASFRIELSRKRGYYLVISDANQFEDFLSDWTEDGYETKNKRMETLLVHLLFHSQYITYRQLADLCGISIAQVKLDCGALPKLLEGSEIKLVTKAHHGIRLQGNLYDKIKLIDAYYIKGQHLILDYISHLVTNPDDISQGVRLICQEYRLRPDGDSARILRRWLELLICYHILNVETQYQSLNLSDMEPLKKILNQYELTRACLPHAQVIYQLLLEHQSINLVPQTALRKFLYQVYTEIDQQFDTRFVEDVDFMRMIQLHVAVMMESNHLADSSKSSLIDSLCREFPAIMNCALHLVKRLEQEYHMTITEEEIVYLTSHMAVSYERQNDRKIRSYYHIALVSSSGGGLAQLMEMRFSKIFPSARIKLFSLDQKTELLAFRPNLVFSIKLLDYPVDCPVVLVKEVLEELDYFSIQNNLEYLTEMGTLLDANKGLLEMISPDLFTIGDYDQYRDLLEDVASKLESYTHSENYVTSILERESYVSTVYDNGLAIPHPMEMKHSENLISVTLLPKGIIHQGKTVKLVFMLALKPNQVEVHQHISKKLYGLMQQSSVVQELANCQNYQEFINLLRICL